ncbi:hypothetical protein [Chryseobacterium lathyri]|nr:hypothetical protein [Chryseobacterium lathyri]
MSQGMWFLGSGTFRNYNSYGKLFIRPDEGALFRTYNKKAAV